jgi:threonine dehydratase
MLESGIRTLSPSVGTAPGQRTVELQGLGAVCLQDRGRKTAFPESGRVGAGDTQHRYRVVAQRLLICPFRLCNENPLGMNAGAADRAVSERDNAMVTRDSILAAYERIRPVVRETPLEESAGLTPDGSVSVFLKLEHLQHTGSFKFRGASHKIALLTAEQATAGVIAASNGNHGLGVAAAAQARGIPAEVYVSSQVSPAKAQRIERHGARIRSVGDDPLTAELAARRAAEESGKVFISPYNDEDVVAGQGTIGVELHRQLARIDAVFVAVGGGGLIGGIGAYLKSVSPATGIVGCWPENSPVLHQCLQAGRIVDVGEQPTLSESTAGGLEPGSVTLDICRGVIDRSVFVSEAEILDAMRLILETEHWLIEGAAGVAVAAFRKEAHHYAGKNVVIVLCGRNLSPEALRKLL